MPTSRSLFRALALFALLAAFPLAAQEPPRWEFEFMERFRVEAWDATLSLDDSSGQEAAYTRARTHLGGRWTPAGGVKVAVRLTNEFRYYLSPAGRSFTLNEGFVDHLFVRWDRPGFTLTLGRQDLMLGEGFIVMDGGPLDGSRSAYFNAARLDLKLAPGQALTAFYLDQPTTDEWLPLIHDQDQPMVEQPEAGWGLYYSGRAGTGLVEGYAVRKTIEATGRFPFASAYNTFGGRVAAPLGRRLTLTLEANGQRGTFRGADMRAWGGHGTLDLGTGRDLPAILTLGLIHLTGDDPDTAGWEGWDPVFSRWPKWSESYIYTQAKEFDGRPAYWSNLGSLYGSVLLRMGPQWDFRLTYHHLTAPHPTPSSVGFADGGGRTRGDLFIGKLTYKDGRRVSGHLIWEQFLPGDHYFDGADPYAWFRVELAYRF